MGLCAAGVNPPPPFPKCCLVFSFLSVTWCSVVWGSSYSSLLFDLTSHCCWRTVLVLTVVFEDKSFYFSLLLEDHFTLHSCLRIVLLLCCLRIVLLLTVVWKLFYSSLLVENCFTPHCSLRIALLLTVVWGLFYSSQFEKQSFYSSLFFEDHVTPHCCLQIVVILLFEDQLLHLIVVGGWFYYLTVLLWSFYSLLLFEDHFPHHCCLRITLLLLPLLVWLKN